RRGSGRSEAQDSRPRHRPLSQTWSRRRRWRRRSNPAGSFGWNQDWQVAAESLRANVRAPAVRLGAQTWPSYLRYVAQGNFGSDIRRCIEAGQTPIMTYDKERQHDRLNDLLSIL